MKSPMAPQTQDRLDREIDNSIEMETMFEQVNELRKARPGPMHSRDFWSSMPEARSLDTEVVKKVYRIPSSITQVRLPSSLMVSMREFLQI